MLARAAGLGWPEAFEHMGQGVRLAAAASASAGAASCIFCNAKY
jgi:hypothetical protein